MKKRLVSLALALVMLVGMIPAGIAAEAIVLPDVPVIDKTYTNILDAGFDGAAILELFPETIETSYDEETGIFKMEDIGADVAYYEWFTMTLEDGYWTTQISPEEYGFG